MIEYSVCMVKNFNISTFIKLCIYVHHVTTSQVVQNFVVIHHHISTLFIFTTNNNTLSVFEVAAKSSYFQATKNTH